MRPCLTLIAAGILAVATVASRETGVHPDPGLPTWALMTFAVAAFSGPVR